MRRGKEKLIILLLFVLTSNCGCSIVLPRADTAAVSIVETIQREGIQWETSFTYKNTEEDIKIEGEGSLYTSTHWTAARGKTKIQSQSIDMTQDFKTETQNKNQTRYVFSVYANEWYEDTANTNNATDILTETIIYIGEKNRRVSRKTEIFNEESCYYVSTPTDNVILLWKCLFPTQYDSFFKTQPFTEKEIEASYAVCFFDKEDTEMIGVSLRARTENEKMIVNLKPQGTKSVEIENIQANDKQELTSTDNPLSKDWTLSIDESTPLVETPIVIPQEDDIIKAKKYSVYENVFYFNGKPLSIPCTCESVESASLHYADDEQKRIPAGETKSAKYTVENIDSVTLFLTNEKDSGECSYEAATVTGIALYAESLTSTGVIMPGGIMFGNDIEEVRQLFQEIPEMIISKDKLFTVMIYETPISEYSISFYGEKLESIEIFCK